MKKLCFSVFGILLTLLVLIACIPLIWKYPQEEKKDKGLVVGFVELLSESSWRDSVYTSIQKAAKEENIQLIVEPANRTQNSQIQAVRTLLTYQVDAIVFSPVVMSGWENVLKEAETAHIPIILIERKVNPELMGFITAYVGTDYEEQGRQAARYILDANKQTSGTVYIMELIGTVGSSTTATRSRGIRDEFNRNEKYEIYYSVSCDMMCSKAKETTEIYLKNGRIPDVLICHNDSMMYGAVEAMKELGIIPGKDVQVISFDAEQAACEMLLAGTINCEIETKPYFGKEVMEIILQLEQHEKIQKEILLPFTIFTQQTPPESTAARGY